VTEREFFYRTLGLCEPWEIRDVKLDVEGKKVEVEVAVKAETKWAQDGELLPIVDYTERRWRHLDTMQLETVLVARVPRVRHPDGRTEMVAVPWAQKRSRWTVEFEALAIDVIRSCSSLGAAGEILRLGWRSLDTIMKRAVGRGLERREVGELKELGLDEKSFRKRHRYGTLVNDIGAGRVLEVVETKTEEAALEALGNIDKEVLEGVEAVAIDMSSAYENAIRAKCPNAVVVYDKFHVMKLLNEAIDKVRRQEDKALRERGDESLKGTRYHWLTGIENMGEKMFPAFKSLVRRAYKTSRAWEHRFLFSSFWEQPSAGKAAEFFKRWFSKAVRSKLAPVVDASRTLKRHLAGLLTYFAHPVTNAMSEGLNSRIEAIKNSARGFHSFETFRTRILFHLGGLDLKPRFSQ
jgi:transposase